ncbi:Hypothetical predicted protein, partial [Scomber scombrus]
NTLTLRRQQKNWTTSEHPSHVLLQKMANLLWITVTLIFLLSAGCSAHRDPKYEADLIAALANAEQKKPANQQDKPADQQNKPTLLSKVNSKQKK